MKLEDSFLCLDCEEVFEKPVAGYRVFCPQCGSEQSQSISKWIKPLSSNKGIQGIGIKKVTGGGR